MSGTNVLEYSYTIEHHYYEIVPFIITWCMLLRERFHKVWVTFRYVKRKYQIIHPCIDCDRTSFIQYI